MNSLLAKLSTIALLALLALPARAADKDHVLSWGVSPTYYVASYPTTPAKRIVDGALYAAFQSWANVCDITFNEVKKVGDANIVIRFDPTVFGGRAEFPYAPLYTGQTTMWLNGATNYNERGFTYLQRFAAHEIGHSIGLLHSTRGDQLMSPFIIGVFEPQWEDRQRAVQIYGPKR